MIPDFIPIFVLAFICLAMMPLAIWKLVDIMLWLVT
jgi:hypothetical protein